MIVYLTSDAVPSIAIAHRPSTSPHFFLIRPALICPAVSVIVRSATARSPSVLLVVIVTTCDPAPVLRQCTSEPASIVSADDVPERSVRATPTSLDTSVAV